MKRIYFFALACIFSTLFYGCVKDLVRDNQLDGKVIPTLTTTVPVTASITATTAVSGGIITNDGGLPITARGICFSASITIPDISNSTKTTDGTGIGTFSSNLTGLIPNTRYNVRAYATNLVGTAYGSVSSFTTPATIATVTTVPITNITSSSVSTGGTILSDGGGAISAKGVCWSLTTTPTINLTTKTNDGTGSANYTSSITSLPPFTTYYVRAYVTNTAGTVYGNELIFQTSARLSTVSASGATSITVNSASVSANITSDGGGGISSRGICWSTNTAPTADLPTKVTDPLTTTAPFSGNLTGLNAGTTYFVRAFVINSAGTAYSNEVSFQTLGSVPILTTAPLTNISQSGATSGGNITNAQGATIITRGVCWSTTSSPTINNSRSTDGGGTGSFVSNITGLSPLTTYFVRAYATSSAGTGYGDQLSFQSTNTSLATITTTAVSTVNPTSATIGGNLTNLGNTSLSEKGVVFNTTGNPTLNSSGTPPSGDSKVIVPGATLGAFSTVLTALSPGTQYFFKAYAINTLGISFGSELNFSTPAITAIVTTVAITSITSTSAVSGGNITSDGGAQITTRGVVWSTVTAPTISLLTKTSNGTGTGSFTSNLTGLTAGTTYFVRAYATNSAGTSYGPEISFRTL